MNKTLNLQESERLQEKRWAKVLVLTLWFSLLVLETAAEEASDVDQLQFQIAKEDQARIAKAGGVDLLHSDVGSSYATRMRGVPTEISSILVYDESYLEPVLQSLLPYYGFTGSEELRLVDKVTNEKDVVYVARQYINGIETPARLRIRVDNSTSQVIRVNGWVYSSLGLESKSRISERAAIELVIDHLESLNPSSTIHDESTRAVQTIRIDGNREALPLYRESGESRELVLWWGIGIELEAHAGQTDSEEIYEWFFVDPAGSVSPWVEGGVSESSQ